jgi:serine phosphatase RsbU (regulator of sigma subunit)
LPCADGCWLGIGDVAGHGLHTGLVMLMIQSIVSATTLAQPGATPATAWATLNAVLHDNVRGRLGRDEHATVTLARFHCDGRLIFSGAHEELIVYRARERRTELLEPPGVWAGIRPDPPDCSRHDGETRLERGDVVLLYTDGLTERRCPERGLFGLERLRETLEQVADRSAEGIRDAIIQRVEAWSSRQRDDLTLVVLQYRGPGETLRPV